MQTVEDLANALIETDKALRARDAATRRALGWRILGQIEAIATNPTWSPAQREAAKATSEAISNLVRMNAGLPPKERQGPERG